MAATMEVIRGELTYTATGCAWYTDPRAGWAEYALDNNDVLVRFIPYSGQLKSVASTIQSWLYPIIEQVIQKPDLATIALLLVIVLVSLKILDMLWQSIKFWLRMVYKVAFWGAMAAMGLWLWTRGPDGVVEDIQHWSSEWSKNYEYYTNKENVARLTQQKAARASPKNRWY